MLLFNSGQIQEVKPKLPSVGEIAWLHLTAPSQDVIQSVVRGHFHCHPLVIEDLTKFGQRPKLDHYRNGTRAHAFISFYDIDKNLDLSELAIVVSDNYIITAVQEKCPWIDALYYEIPDDPEIMENTGTLLHRILDECVDGYFDVVDQLENRMEHLERKVFNHPEAQEAGTIFRLKQKLNRARRVAAGGRNVVELLAHQAFPFTDERHVVYFVDIFDHISRVVDSFDAVRDGLSGLLDLQMAQRANRMNEVMKTLTIFATIFLPLSFIVGLYGMNFKDIPELSWSYGYLYVWAIMLAVTAGLVWYFKKKRWW